jgi:ABC-type polysaccharide/polyol phosphate transport system ATPase subunit
MILSVKNIKKNFRIYSRPRYWLLEKLFLGKRPYHKDIWALKGVSFELEQGDCLGLIGKNGAGKSTLLRIIAGISPPSAGSIECRGKLASLLELGSGFHPEFTGRENLRLNGMIAGFSAAELEQKVQGMIEFSELGEFIDLPVRTYSDGMSLRLGFSLAQALDPDLLLIDEALAVGDEYFRSKCLRRMLEFKDQGKSMLIASHDLTMVRGLCNRAVYLKHGEAKKIGQASEVIEYYLEEIYQEALAGGGEAPLFDAWKRRGSGEAKIISVWVRNSSGRDTLVLRPGEDVQIGFSYRTEKELPEPLFGINIFRSDGVLVLSTNQQCANACEKSGAKLVSQLTGPVPAGHTGTVSYDFKNLLLPGRYQLSVNIFKGRPGACLPVDEVFDVLRFEVVQSEIMDRGVFLNPACWRIS